MSGGQSQPASSLPRFEHASVEEYRTFVEAHPASVVYRKSLLKYRARFVRNYPDLQEWFAAPLVERVGRQYGDRPHHVSYPVSYRARPYLKFLALHGYMQLDWDWICAIEQIELKPVLAYDKGEAGLQQLVEEAVELGYARQSAKGYLQWVTDRIFLHTAEPHVDALREAHLEELEEAFARFGEREDVALFYGSTQRYHALAQWHSRALHMMRVVLYHRGQVPTEQRRVRRQPPPPPVLKPRMEAVVARYLSTRRLTDRPGTIGHIDAALRQLIAWLARTSPSLMTFAEVTREHLLAYAEALNTEPNPRTKQPIALSTKLGILSILSVFFQDVVQWQWEDVPRHPLLYSGDLPKRPLRVPRYIPEHELAPLMDAVRRLACPYQRAALLIARWSGARRGEIRRLSLDCLDTYPDGMPRLHIPVGKTRKERVIPLHEEAAEAIRALQTIRKRARGLRDEPTGVMTHFLFVFQGRVLSADYLFDSPLDQICRAAGLLTPEGKPTITAHRFRHTVGTQLANRGAKLHTVMKVLGHQSANMALVYAQISDSEVLKDYQAVLGPGAIIAGPAADALRTGDLSSEAVDWLKANLFKTELELGRCLRLPQEGPCECDLYLTCAKFVTTPEYAPRLRRRRRIEQELVADALARGWQREVERHQCTIRRLEQLLVDLGEPLDGPEEID